MSKRKTAEEKALDDVAKLQSARDFTRGLKSVTAILKKNPKCSEALAYQAYFSYLKEKETRPECKEECIKMAKEANRLNFNSALTWKICGLLYREMNDFMQFFQCYKLSNMKDPSDMIILSELCNLHFFFCNYEDFLASTRTLLQQNTSAYGVMRYALGLYFTGRYQDCDHFLGVYQENWTPTKTEDDGVFRSEFCLFRCMVFQKMGHFKECLSYIDASSMHIRDTVKMRDAKIQCLKELGEIEKMMSVIEKQIECYPEDGDYFDIIEATKTKEEVIALCIEYKDKFKSKYAWVRALELMDVKDPLYEPMLSDYLKPLVIKAAPAIYQTVKMLSDEGIDLAFKIISEMKTPINCVPIVKLFRANVFYRKHELEAALAEVNAGLEHTTTAIELLVWKAKFLRDNGRAKEAMSTAKELYLADPADRSSNLLYVQTALLCGMRNTAKKEAGVFAGVESGKPLLFETQFNTYYLRAGFAHLRAGDYNQAREMYEGIFKHFDNYRIGEYHYIGWASKKPRALVELTDYLAILEREKQFYEAASYAIRIAIYEKRAAGYLSQAQQAMKSLNPETLALCCHIFLANKKILPAIRCWRIIGDSPFKYLALPAVQEISKLEMPAIVKETVDKFFQVPEKSPSTFQELFASAEGKLIFGDKAGSIKDIEAAIALGGLNYKQALKCYTIVQAFFGEDISKIECPKLETTYPKYEFKLMDEDHELEIIKQKREAKEEQRKQRRLKREEAESMNTPEKK